MDIADKAIAAEDPIERNGDQRQEQQRQHPGDGALGAAHVHEGMRGVNGAGGMPNQNTGMIKVTEEIQHRWLLPIWLSDDAQLPQCRALRSKTAGWWPSQK